IGITHELLRRCATDAEVQRLIVARGFRLLLDETLDELIERYNGIDWDEFLWHKELGHLEVDEECYGKLRWIDKSIVPYKGKFP
ncbi:hypothetical protein, partial [Escherichia coli]|uniref:hypothetical protein n=1 Tax=Escherichia coli TaxID=562 RepID=UPI0028DE027C